MRWWVPFFLVACSSGDPSSVPGPGSSPGGAGGNDGGPSRGGGGSAGEGEGEGGDLSDPDGAAGPEIRQAPSIVGDAIEGATLTASFGKYSEGATLEGVWQRCADATCQKAANAEDGTGYVLRAADVGYRMRLRVTATDAEGSTIAISPSTDVVVGIGEIVNKELPVLGAPFVFRALELTPGIWLSDRELTPSYQWQRCVRGDCEDIAGATDKSYTPAIGDLGARLKVVETVASDDERFSASSEETNEVTCAEPLASAPLSATSASHVASGVKWTFPGGIFPATSQAIGPAKRSALFVSHGFGYSLPESQVQGIEVRVTRRASRALAIRDQRIALYAPAARTKVPSGAYWTAGSVTAVYGGPTDTWGQTISTAVVNSSQLRLALAVENAGEEAADAIIEKAEVVVYYASVTSSVFNATTVSAGGTGSDWVNAAAAVNENSAVATFSIPATATPTVSKALTVGGFGAALATGEVPSGFALEVRQAASAGLLVNSAIKAGTATETKNQLPPTLGYVSYGGPGAMWGLTSEQVTSAAFSAQLQVMGQGVPLAGSVQVDAVRLRVYFGSQQAEEKRSATVLETTSNEVGWSSVNNALTEDEAVATTTLLSDQRASGSLITTGFAGVVPVGAAISGITLDVKRSATAAEQLQDIAVFLRSGAGTIGLNHALPAFWPLARSKVSYGGPNDRWSASLNATEVNSGALGAELTVAHASSTGAAAPEVDSVSMTVHYCTD
ncbi:MAG TPA: hypothetical protein VJV79_07755 [Polyangiaceae bacterium]|nr:hypothetical protein [Polyangiaceae bacterium]